MKRPAPAVGQLPTGARCESCRRGPAVALIQLSGAAPFTVCGGCVPEITPMDADDAREASTPRVAGMRDVPRPRSGDPATDERGGLPPVIEDVPPPDWAGVVRLPVDRRELAWVAFCLSAAPGLAAAVWFATGSPVGMVATGTTVMLVAVTVDRRRLGLPRWGWHRLTPTTARARASSPRPPAPTAASPAARYGAPASTPTARALLIEEDR